MNRQTVHQMNFVLYSPQQLVTSDGAGFWSNDQGWVEFRAATRFTAESVPSCNLPISEGRDAKWIMWEPHSQAAHVNAGQSVQVCLPLSA